MASGCTFKLNVHRNEVKGDEFGKRVAHNSSFCGSFLSLWGVIKTLNLSARL